MATFRNASSVSFSAASSSITKPTSLAENDVQLAFITADGTAANLSISGGATWTQIGTTQTVSNGDTARVALYRQVAGASEPASYTVSNSSSTPCSCVLVAYSGVDTTSPIAAQLATNPNSVSPPASPVSIAANAITTTAANQTVVWFGFVDWNTSTAAAFTDPSSTTRRAVQTPAQFSCALAVDFVQTSAGTTGTITGTGTLSAAAGNFVAWLVALADLVPPATYSVAWIVA